MTPARRILLYVLLLAGLLGSMLWYAYGRMERARGDYRAAASQLDEARRLTREIVSLHGGERVAGDSEVAEGELTRRIESAADAAGIPPSQIVRIDPASARRVGDSSYQSKPTRIQVRDVTLVQAATFLQTLIDRGGEEDGTGLEAMTLRLSASRNAAGEGTAGVTDSGLWGLDATVSYLIYAPRPSPASTPGRLTQRGAGQ